MASSTEYLAGPWTLRGRHTEYSAAVPAHGRWLEPVYWGPNGSSPRPAWPKVPGPAPFVTEGDAARIEYATDGMRSLAAADLVVETDDGHRSVVWQFVEASVEADGLRATFKDPESGLLASLRYRLHPSTDVVERWVQLTNEGRMPLRIVRAASAAFSMPTPRGADLTYMWGQWTKEYQIESAVLRHGQFQIGSSQGATGHAFAPWLAVQDHGATGGPTWGVALAWSGSWEITAQRDTSGVARVQVGRRLVDGPLELAAGDEVSLPVAAGACSTDGIDELARVWHDYQRQLAGARLEKTRPVVFNSFGVTEFEIDARQQFALAEVAAEIGVETFVVDDGWFIGRHDDTGGLGDWTPDLEKFPEGLDAFIASIRSLGMTFGLWVEPEAVSPKSQLFRDHPDWIYAIDGRPKTLMRNQYLLDLGRSDVAEFVYSSVDDLLTRFDIGYLKWDFNRPRTESARPRSTTPHPDLDGQHVANLHRILSDLRRGHPEVIVENCASGGGRNNLAMAADADVFAASDNGGPSDRLRIQFGFLHAFAPHLLSSWMTDRPGVFDLRPRSDDFRFVVGMSGALGVDSDLRRWTADARAHAAEWVRRYKAVRDVIIHGTLYFHGGPDDPQCALQYNDPKKRVVVVLAWHLGSVDSPRSLKGRPRRFPLQGLLPNAVYSLEGGGHFTGRYLTTVGLPLSWMPDRDAEMVVLRRDYPFHSEPRDLVEAVLDGQSASSSVASDQPWQEANAGIARLPLDIPPPGGRRPSGAGFPPGGP